MERARWIGLMDLEELIKSAIHLYNDGSDNTEYLRGQLELAEFLLGKPLEED